MRIAIYGLGYVGMTSALMICERGHQVEGLELVKEKRDLLSRGELHLYENGLKDLLKKHQNNENFVLTEKSNYSQKQIILLTVGTPSTVKGDIDLGQVKAVLKEIIQNLNRNEKVEEVLIILRSTVPVGASEKIILPLLDSELRKDLNWDYAFYPEFLREGSAISDFEKTEQAVIASFRENTLAEWNSFFATLPGFQTPLKCSFKTAEMMKLAFNSYNALRVSFSNELYSIAGAHGVDSNELQKVQREILRSQENNYLSPGFSFGGHCLSKDLSCLIQLGREKNIDSQLLRSINESNEEHYIRYLDLIEGLNPKTILLTGITFKPGTDDSRNSYPLRLLKDLLETPLYKDQRKIYLLEDDLALEKANLNGLNIQRVQEEEIEHLEIDTLILGPRLLEEQVLAGLLSKGIKTVDLKFHEYCNRELLHPFKESNGN